MTSFDAIAASRTDAGRFLGLWTALAMLVLCGCRRSLSPRWSCIKLDSCVWAERDSGIPSLCWKRDQELRFDGPQEPIRLVDLVEDPVAPVQVLIVLRFPGAKGAAIHGLRTSSLVDSFVLG